MTVLASSHLIQFSLFRVAAQRDEVGSQKHLSEAEKALVRSHLKLAGLLQVAWAQRLQAGNSGAQQSLLGGAARWEGVQGHWSVPTTLQAVRIMHNLKLQSERFYWQEQIIYQQVLVEKNTFLQCLDVLHVHILKSPFYLKASFNFTWLLTTSAPLSQVTGTLSCTDGNTPIACTPKCWTRPCGGPTRSRGP